MMRKHLYRVKQKSFRYLKKAFKPYYKTQNEYWVQRIELKRSNSRFEFFVNHCRDKDVIHFGCTDWPVFNPNNNLHIDLEKYTNSLHGFDVDKEGIEILKSM